MVKSHQKRNIEPRKIITNDKNSYKLMKQNKGKKKEKYDYGLIDFPKDSLNITLQTLDSNYVPFIKGHGAEICQESDTETVIQTSESHQDNKKVINVVEDHIKLNKVCHDIVKLDKKIDLVSKNSSHHNICKLNKNMEILNQKVDNVIDEIDSKEYPKHNSCNYQEVDIKCKHITFLLNTKAIISEHSVEICGTISEFKVKINEIKGELEFSNCIIPSEIDDNNSCGFMHIYNLDNNNLYIATIYPKCNKLYYVFSNRPIVPLGIHFNSIISINIKISYL